jgi:bifunctional DNase/RNase
MTSVRIARAEHRPARDRQPHVRVPSYLVVLADDAGGRELPIWLLAFDRQRLQPLLERDQAGPALAATADDLTAELLRAADTRVSGVDIDELGPEVAAARIRLASPVGPQQVTARLAEGLAIAIAAGAPLRIADAVMDRLARPSTPGAEVPDQPPEPALSPSAPEPARPPGVPERRPAVPVPGRPPRRPRFEPRNLAFADGLDGWLFAGNFAEHASESHWHDYACTAENGSAVLSSAVPEPAGFAVLGQELFADDYRSAMITFRGEFRIADAPGRAGLFLRVNEGQPIRGPVTDRSVFADPDNNFVTIPASSGWTRHEVTARVPDDTDAFVFGVFLAGAGQLEARNTELAVELT